MPFHGIPRAAVELEDPAGDVVEEVAVVGDRDDGALVLLQVLLEPRHGLGVEVVRGLVEEEDVGLGQQQAAERHAAQLAAGEHLDGRVAGRAAQRVHRQLEAGVEVPGVGGVELLLHLALAGEEPVHLVGLHRLGELVGDRLELREQVHGALDRFPDDVEDGLARVELRLLFEEADGVPGGGRDLADELLLDAGHDAQQRALP